jgi:hypothetical protein
LIAARCLYNIHLLQTLLGKLLVTTGGPSDTSVKSEVIDLLDASNICQDLADYPLEVKGAVGGLLNHVLPLVCGGDPAGVECHIVGQSGPKTQLLEERSNAASLVLNHTHIWITGGYNGNELSSTELVSVGQNTTKGPELPMKVSSHCLVTVNDSTAMLIGGYTNSERSEFPSRDESYYMSLQDGVCHDYSNVRGGGNCEAISEGAGVSFNYIHHCFCDPRYRHFEARESV